MNGKQNNRSDIKKMLNCMQIDEFSLEMCKFFGKPDVFFFKSNILLCQLTAAVGICKKNDNETLRLFLTLQIIKAIKM